MGNAEKRSPLYIVGPRGIKRALSAMMVLWEGLPYRLVVIEKPIGSFSINSPILREIEISSLDLDHSTECLGYSLYFKRNREFDPDKALENQVPKRLWRHLQAGQTFYVDDVSYTPDMVLGKPRPGIKFSYITDTRPIDAIIPFIESSRLFVCEAMYGDDLDIGKAVKNKSVKNRAGKETAIKEKLTEHEDQKRKNNVVKEEAVMARYQDLSIEELESLRKELKQSYREYQNMDLNLDMSRGKPSLDQLDLSNGMMDALNSEADMYSSDGFDVRNYGVLGGIAEAKELLSDMMENNPDNIIIFGNSSLNVMYDSISRSYSHGVMGNTPWCKLDKIKWLCPVPGYDRHFAITEYFGIEMINVPMTEKGPDMDIVEELVASDESIKGIWCVPKYSNPQGYSYSDETVRRFARLKPAAKDFRIYWDNAYGMHHLYDHDQDYLIEILAECKRAGNPDLVYKFASTSKISFPGSGIASMATSLNNLEDIKKQMQYQTIGHDKVNQLRHVRFFEDIHGMVKHMMKHADIIRPKFEMVESVFEKNLNGLDIGSWTNPKGGYFISFETLPGCAKEVVDKCKKAGVKLTSAGATFPYGKDPEDSNIRIAPTYPPLEDLRIATELFCLCVKLISVEKLLKKKTSGLEACTI